LICNEKIVKVNDDLSYLTRQSGGEVIPAEGNSGASALQALELQTLYHFGREDTSRDDGMTTLISSGITTCFYTDYFSVCPPRWVLILRKNMVFWEGIAPNKVLSQATY
jgi:hypothetical protein